MQAISLTEGIHCCLHLAVYIPPAANATLALAQLHDSINNCLVAYPDTVFIAARINCEIRGEKTLDQVYNNVANTY